jgi:hypothetical protein
MFGNGDLDHGIAEKLEALVVERKTFSFEGNARVGERLGEEKAVAEFVDNPLLERIHDRNLRGFHHLKPISRGESDSTRTGMSNMEKD